MVLPLLVLLLTFVLAMPANAVPPVGNSGDLDYDFPMFTCEEFGFDVYDTGTRHFSEKSYFDQDGNLVKIHGHASGIDTLHREGDYTRVLSSPYSEVYDWDAVAMEMKYSGVIFNIHLPEGRIVLKEAGTGIFNASEELIKRAGIELVDTDAMCRYFAGQ